MTTEEKNPEFEASIAKLTEMIAKQLAAQIAEGGPEKIAAAQAAQTLQVPCQRFLYDNGRLKDESHEDFERIAHRTLTLAGAFGSAIANVVYEVDAEEREKAMNQIGEAFIDGLIGGIRYLESDEDEPIIEQLPSTISDEPTKH